MSSASTWTLSRPDGAEIAVHTRGEGPDVVLVHGTACDHRVWARVARRLAKGHRLHALDRRGRASSTDGQAWSLAEDAGDVAAIAEKLGREVPVIGHSLGGIVALEAALAGDAVGPLAVYEPPLFGEERPPMEAARELEHLLETEGPEAAVERFLREVGYTDGQLETLRRAEPIWQATVATAPTLPRETEADLSYEVDPGRLKAIGQPVLLLEGEASPGDFDAGLDALAKALPDVRRDTIAGASHGVLHEAPGRLAKRLQAFLDEHA